MRSQSYQTEQRALQKPGLCSSPLDLYPYAVSKVQVPVVGLSSTFPPFIFLAYPSARALPMHSGWLVDAKQSLFEKEVCGCINTIDY